MTPEIILLVFMALAFDFLNGFHDSANAIATVVSTRVLSPRLAVMWAAFFDFRETVSPKAIVRLSMALRRNLGEKK